MVAPERLSLASLIGNGTDDERTHGVAPAAHAVAGRFWDAALNAPHLSQRMKQLVLVALHANASAIDEQAIARHVRAAVLAGASNQDVIDVLLSIVGAANHAVYFAAPILAEEWSRAYPECTDHPPAMREDVRPLKQAFIELRGFWNEQRELIARLMPDYFAALSDLSMEPWKTGSLSPKEREIIYIAIDSSITHMYEPGLRMHIRNAIGHGATREEIAEVFQLGALMGMEGYLLGCRALGA